MFCSLMVYGFKVKGSGFRFLSFMIYGLGLMFGVLGFQVLGVRG